MADKQLLVEQVRRLLLVFAVVLGLGQIWSRSWRLVDQLLLPFGISDNTGLSMGTFEVALFFVVAEFVGLRARLGKRHANLSYCVTLCVLVQLISDGPWLVSQLVKATVDIFYTPSC